MVNWMAYNKDKVLCNPAVLGIFTMINSINIRGGGGGGGALVLAHGTQEKNMRVCVDDFCHNCDE